jgi:hypothetical protein
MESQVYSMPTPGLRLSAVAAFLGATCWMTAAMLFPAMSDALDPTALDHGLAELVSHPAAATMCQHLFAVSDIALIVFMFGLASLAPPPRRSLAWLGAFLFGTSFALDVTVAARVIGVTQFIAPHAAADSAMHAAGIATLGVAAVVDFREDFLWMAGSFLLGGAAWHGRYWPRWLAGLAVLNGILSFPYLPFSMFFISAVVFTIWVLGMGVTLWQRGARA